MPALIDLTGRRFGKLVVRERGPNDNQKRPRWHCRCDCGGEALVSGANLRNGITRSCGCIVRSGDLVRRHGMRHSPEYEVWKTMKARCNNPRGKAYKNYGGRGIKVCDRWLERFENFISDMGRRPSKLHTIERLDNDGDYSPENCEWLRRELQARNRRNNRCITHLGETLTLTGWAERAQVRESRLRWRLNNGWALEAALHAPQHMRIKRALQQWPQSPQFLVQADLNDSTPPYLTQLTFELGHSA